MRILDGRGTWRLHAGSDVLRLSSIPVLVAVLSGCEEVPKPTTFEPVTDPAKLYMALTLDHRAVNLATNAPYDTFRLTATPRNALGEAIVGLPQPTYRSGDTTRVWVTADGLLKARAAATGVPIIAELVADGNVRHADTAYVSVTSQPGPPPELVTFSITPESAEDRVWPMLSRSQAGLFGAVFILPSAGINVVPSLALRALDANGAPVTGLEVDYVSLDPENVVILNRRTGELDVLKLAPGEARVVARTVAYGVAKADTAVFTVTLPAVHGSLIAEGPGGKLVLDPTEVTIRPNGYVFWFNTATIPVDITFDDPSNVAEIVEVCAVFGEEMCGAGDIPAFEGSSELPSWRGRQFPVPGIYTYRSTLTGLSGRVIVAESGNPASERRHDD